MPEGPFDAPTQPRPPQNTGPAAPLPGPGMQPPNRANRPGRQINILKWSLGCAGLGMLLIAGAIMLTLILAPIIFRNLDGELQSKLVRRFPFIAALQPTVPFQVLPTFAATSPNALALLATPVGAPTRSTVAGQGLAAGEGAGTTVPTATAVPPTITILPTTAVTTTAPTLVPSATTVPATATQAVALSTEVLSTFTALPTSTVIPTNTPFPTSVLVSDTPVPVGIVASPTVEVPTLPPPSATTVPTLVPTRVPPTLTPVPIPSSFHATGYKWVPQTWNNCGPANLSQALHFFNWQGDQKDAAAYLKPNREDKNVSPWQIVNYVNNYVNKAIPVKAVMRAAGDFKLIQRLIYEKFAVIMETGYDVANEGWMGHYLTVIGYDDTQRLFYGLDTYLGDDKDNLGYREKYDDLDRRWQQFNRVYIVFYPPDREGELASILGPDADLTYNAQHALNVARAEANAAPNNQFAWFNVGSSYVMLSEFGYNYYKEAAAAFDQALNVGGGLPFRFLWYQFTPYEAYYNVGNYSNVMALVNATLQTTTYVEETYYWRGMVEAAQGKSSQAMADFKRVLQFNPNFTPATDRLAEVQNGNFKPPAVAQAGQ